MTEQQLTALIGKYLSGKATAEEKRLVEHWYESFEANPLEFMEGQTPDIIQSAARSLEAVREKTARAGAGRSAEIPRQAAKTRTFHWRRVAAAAAVLVALSGALYLMWRHAGPPADLAAQPVLHDIKPGGNKAVLTLGNGQHIILNNTNNGLLSVQGNTKVIKQKGGLLTYHAADKAKGKKQQTTVSYNTISTPRGGQYQVQLADGSKVWLNSASSLRFPTAFTGPYREVAITGEAYFEIAQNRDQPFKVSVREMTVNVLGTHFNIMAYDDESLIKTTLLEGAVKITEGDEALVLKPGQEATLGRDNRLTLMDDVNVSRVVAWKDGLFWFDNDNIESVTRQLSRWYNVDIRISGQIPDLFTGSIPRNIPFSKVFDVLQKTGSIRYKMEDNKIIISPSNT